MDTTSTEGRKLSRRQLLAGTAGVAAAGAFGGTLLAPSTASAAVDGYA